MAQITGQGRYLNPVQNVLSEARTLDIAKDSKMNDILPLLHENVLIRQRHAKFEIKVVSAARIRT